MTKVFKLLTLPLIFLGNDLHSQIVNIRFNGFKSYNLTYEDSAAIINLAEEEGVDSAYVMKLSDIKLIVTIRSDEYDVQYILNDRYIDRVIKYYPDKTLFYDKNYRLCNPKTSD